MLADNQQLFYLDQAQYYLHIQRTKMEDDSAFAEHRQYEGENVPDGTDLAANGFDRDTAWTAPADSKAMERKGR